MDVYVVRHAIAEERDPARWPDDALRPLTAVGEERFRRAARGLSRIVDPPVVVLSSPYARAWRTAELLGEEAGWPLPTRCDPLAAAHGPEDAAASLPSDVASVALVGHEPMLSELVALLTGGGAVEMRKGATALVSFCGEPRAGAGTLRWLAQPRLLRALDSSGERS